MTSSVHQFNQVTVISEVTDVVVTDAVDDGTSTGTWIRSIRIFGTPTGDGLPPVFELRVKSTTKSNLDVTTPILNF